MSHSAMSIAASASVKRPPGPDEPAAARSLSTIASMRIGSSPIVSAPSPSTVALRAPVIGPPKNVRPTPSIPASVPICSATNSRVAPATAGPSASGSSAGSRTIWEWMLEIFMLAPLSSV
jgi:hypothetical protein